VCIYIDIRVCKVDVAVENSTYDGGDWEGLAVNCGGGEGFGLSWGVGEGFVMTGLGGYTDSGRDSSMFILIWIQRKSP